MATIVTRLGKGSPLTWQEADANFTNLNTFTQSGVGAVPRITEIKLRELVSVTDFGAVGDGATNDTAAINAAVAYANLTEKCLLVPAGIYWYDGGAVLGAGIVVYGEGRNLSVILSRLATPTSGFLFDAAGFGSGLKSLRLQAGQTQTGGTFLKLSGPESFIDDFEITGDINGILMTGNVARIRHGRFGDGATNAIRIIAEGGDNSQLIDDVLMGAQEPQICQAGIRVRNSSALIISNTSVITQGIGLLIDPHTSTQGAATDAGSVFSLWAHHCFFDNSGSDGIRIFASGTGSVARCRFDNVWASSSSGNGVNLVNYGSGTISGIHFESCHVILNTSSGYSFGGTLSDIAISGGFIGQNLFGVYVNHRIDRFKLLGASVGSGGGVSGNTNVGVVFDAGASASTEVIIANNTMVGNGGGALYVTALSAANDVIIAGNTGTQASNFTPVLTFAVPGDLSVAYTSQAGYYTRSGDSVTASFVVALSTFTHSTASGILRITGLPVPSGTPVASGSVELQGVNKAGYSSFSLSMGDTASYCTIRASGNGQFLSDVVAGDVASGGSIVIRGTITYLV